MDITTLVNHIVQDSLDVNASDIHIEPWEDTTEPAEDTTEPAEDTTEPAEDTTEPAEDTKANLRNQNYYPTGVLSKAIIWY